MNLLYHTLAFFCLYSLVVLGASVTSEAKAAVFSNDLHVKIDALRATGKGMLGTKDYSKAINYYSAILQLVEGIHGEEAIEMRRRCGLTIAECELKNGQLQNAIARCSEVIDEFNNEKDEKALEEKKSSNPQEYQQLMKAMAMAHCRRALALKLLDKVNLASLEIKRSMKLDPKYTKSKLSKSKLSSSNTNTKITKDEEKRLREELLDFAEDCQCNFPRKSFTEDEIDKLYKFSKNYKNKLSKRAHSITSSISTGGNNAFGGFPASSSMSGFPFASLMEGDNMIEMANNFAPTIANMIGWKEQSVRNMISTLKIISKVASVIRDTYTIISKHKEKIILLVTLIWVLSVTKNYYDPYIPAFLHFGRK